MLRVFREPKLQIFGANSKLMDFIDKHSEFVILYGALISRPSKAIHCSCKKHIYGIFGEFQVGIGDLAAFGTLSQKPICLSWLDEKFLGANKTMQL